MEKKYQVFISSTYEDLKKEKSARYYSFYELISSRNGNI